MVRVPPHRTDGERTVRRRLPWLQRYAAFTWLYTFVFTAFGVGAWISVRANRALRIGAGLLIAYGLWNIMGAIFPLRLGEDTSIPMHIVVTNIQLALMVAAMCFVAAGFHGRMRIYSILSLAASALTGIIAFRAAPGPNLVLGISERISIGAFLLWVAVLAVVLWKRTTAAGSKTADSATAKS